ncbi:YczE/YyaS/YitT family protein [Clostridium paraputrificum]|uniref:YczE/YyaS/YitT family protein n=1 Tax=Clostridium paraputrificum TaxID=29363 RepID=UPI003D33BEA4
MNIYKKISLFLFGILIMSLGAVLLSKTDLGVAPWEAINFGLSYTIGLTPGVWIIILSLLSLIIASILEKKLIKLSSFVTSIIIGSFVDLWMFILDFISLDNMMIRSTVFVLAIIISSLGIAIYLYPQLPANPIDYLMLVIKNKFNLKIVHAKLLLDVILFILAIIFNGPIGLGTIILTLFIGPSINFWQVLLEKVYRCNI